MSKHYMLERKYLRRSMMLGLYFSSLVLVVFLGRRATAPDAATYAELVRRPFREILEVSNGVELFSAFTLFLVGKLGWVAENPSMAVVILTTACLPLFLKNIFVYASFIFTYLIIYFDNFYSNQLRMTIGLPLVSYYLYLSYVSRPAGNTHLVIGLLACLSHIIYLPIFIATFVGRHPRLLLMAIAAVLAAVVFWSPEKLYLYSLEDSSASSSKLFLFKFVIIFMLLLSSNLFRVKEVAALFMIYCALHAGSFLVGFMPTVSGRLYSLTWIFEPLLLTRAGVLVKLIYVGFLLITIMVRYGDHLN